MSSANTIVKNWSIIATSSGFRHPRHHRELPFEVDPGFAPVKRRVGVREPRAVERAAGHPASPSAA